MNYIPHFSLVNIAGFVLVLSFYYLWRRKTDALMRKGNSPPEPSGAWPIIGHLHLLRGENPVSWTLGAMADKLGPIFSMQFGANRALVISSWEAVTDCFTIDNDKAFVNRPLSSTGKYLAYNYAAFGFAPYGPLWRDLRKIVMHELLSNSGLERVKHVRISELEESMKELYNSVIDDQKNNYPGKVVNISKWFDQLFLNIIVKTIAGKRYVNSLYSVEDEEAKQFRKLVKEFMYAAGEFVISDKISLKFLEWIDFRGNIKNMKRIAKEFDAIMQSWIDEHCNRRQKSDNRNEHDFIDVMLSVIDDKITYGFTHETIIKATILNILVGSADTIHILLTWLMSLLMNNKHIMKLAQDEIDTKIGKERVVEESDIENLTYLRAIVKETLRLYPPGPLLVPREAIEDCRVGGYLIPKGTHLLVNAWKLHRDPRVWVNPDEFQPERFLTTHADKDVYGQHFEYVPFGSGRRSCPETAYAMCVVHITLARVLQSFNFATQSDLPVDMKEGPVGLTFPKANPLEVLITPRLPAFLYTD